MGIVRDLNELGILASQISGQLVDGQIASLSGSKINSGTVAAAYIDSAIARLASPAFTGTPTTPDVASVDASTKIANTNFVNPTRNFTASSGSYVFANGFKICWGYQYQGDHGGGGFGGANGSINFDGGFTTGILGLVATIYDANATASIILNTYNWSQSGFYWATSEMAAITQDYYIMYIALGY